MKKRIYTLAILMFTLLSCFVFSACGNKYKKLSMEFYSGGNAVSSVNLILDEDNDYRDELVIGVKFSGIKQKEIGDVRFEFPTAIGLLSNQKTDGKFVYITLTVTAPVENEDIYLKVIHTTSGKSKSLPVVVDQKSNDLELIANTYIVSIPSNGTKTHTIDVDSIVNLLPEGSTDDVLFAMNGTYNNNFIRTIKEGDYIKGFEVDSRLTSKYEISGLYPVTLMEDEDSADKYKAKTFKVVFIPTLKEGDLSIVSDSAHMYDGKLYDPIHLIANDTNKATDDYNYNNFYVQLQYKEAVSRTKFLNGYDDCFDFYKVELENAANITSVFNEDKTRVYIQAKNMNEQVKAVKIRLVPNNCVGDIQEIELSVNIKADIKPEDIVIKKGQNPILANNTDIYDVYTGDLTNQMLSFTPELSNGLSTLQNMRILVPTAYLNAYVSATQGLNHVYTDDTFTTSLNSIQLSAIHNLRNNDELLSLYKNNTYTPLNFYYEDGVGFISETITKNDRLFIKYVVNTVASLNDSLSMRVFNYYSGDHKYLENIDCRDELITFNSKLGVEDAKFDMGIVTMIGGAQYTPKTTDNPGSIYIDRSESSADKYYALRVKSASGINGSKLSSIPLNVKLTANKDQTNPMQLSINSSYLDESGAYIFSESNINTISSYIRFVLEGLDIGEYTVTIYHDSGYEYNLKVYVYDSSVVDTTQIKVTGEYVDNTLDTYAGYGDYIVASGKTLTFEVNHSVPNWYVEGYEFSATIDGVAVADLSNYYTMTYSGKIVTLRCLKGTYIDGEKDILLTITVKYKYDSLDNLQLSGVVEKDEEISVFVYDEIKEEDFSINHSEVDVYSYDLLGVYNKVNSQIELNVSLPNKENLWNYTQKGTQSYATNRLGDVEKDVDVVWHTNSDSYALISTLSQNEKDIKLQFSGSDSYDIVITPIIKQFDKVFDHLSCVIHVRKPIITSSLSIEFTKTAEKKEIEIENDILNIRKGVEYYVDVENIANSSIITNKDTLLVVVNNGGEVVLDVVSVEQLSISEWKIALINGAELSDDLRLLIFAKDALKKRIYNSSYDLTRADIGDYLLNLNAYHEYRLSLSDGTIENRYWIESADDFWEIKENDTLKDKHFVVKKNINLKNTTYTPGVINGFTGSITTYDFANVPAGITDDEFKAKGYYEIVAGKFEKSTSYVSTATYYENKYFSMFGLELNNDKKNLIEHFSGVISSINFVVKFDYNTVINAKTNFGIIATNTGSLNNVTAEVSGQAIFNMGANPFEVNYGILVGVNEGDIKIDDKTLVGVTGEISLTGSAQVRFGAVAGENKRNISGVIAEDSLAGHEFVVAFADQGAMSNLVINSSLEDSNTTIGGIVGYNSGKLTDLFVTGKINSAKTSNVGGVVGTNETTVQEVTVNYSGANYTGLGFNTNKTMYDLANIKSSVLIQAKDNVGGIVGLDKGGNYYYCRYQVVADVEKYGIEANNNVGGIAGSSRYGKFIYCSVYGYRWDYNQFASGIVTTFDNKNADIFGQNNVGGIVGFAYINYSATTRVDEDSITAIKQSSVNGNIEATSVAGAIVGRVEQESGTTTSMPVDMVYFMGKLNASTYHPQIVDEASIIYVNYYCLYIDADGDKKDMPGGSYPSGAEYWGIDPTINANKPYVFNPAKSGPIFDRAPTTIEATVKKFEKTIDGRLYELASYVEDDVVHIDFYQTKLSVLDPDYEVVQAANDNKFNIYNFVDFLTFNCEPSGSYRFKVVSSNSQIAEVLSTGKLKIKGTGVVQITFVSVLNSEAKCTITIEIDYPINPEYAISNLPSNIIIESPETVITGQAKQYFVHENFSFDYRTDTELGYVVNIVNYSYNVEEYIKVSNRAYSNDMVIEPGTRLSFELIKTVDTIFEINVRPFVYMGNVNQAKKYANELVFDLSTKQGISKIKLNYENVVIYPNDDIYITATFTTDKALEKVDIKDICSSTEEAYINTSYVEGSLGEFVIVGGQPTGTQVARYKVSVADAAKYLTDSKIVKVNVSKNGVWATASFELLAQRIDNIDIKNYATTKIDDQTYKIDTLSRILRPSYNGVMVLDVVPSNGQFEHVEITDITGSEEIVFTQIDCGAQAKEGDVINGEGLDAERIENGLRLFGKSSRYYVMTRISAEYTSRIHTIKVTAKSALGAEIATTYYYIDVKMMPSVTMKYFDPNGIETAVSKDVDDKAVDINNNQLYLANGVSGVDFYITSANSDGNIDISLYLTDADVSQYFEMVKLQKDHYELNFKSYDPSLIGKTLSITATTRATMDNGTVEYESTTFKFVITQFVVHNISVNNTRRLGTSYDYELYGDYSIPVELKFYFDKTDISFYNANNPYSEVYEYGSEEYKMHVDTASTIGHIYKILREVNTNPQSYIKLNGNTWSGATITESGKITLSRDASKDITTLNVDKDEVVADSLVTLNLPYNYNNNEINPANKTVEIGRRYSFNFTDRTSLLKMQSINNEEEFLNMKSSDTGYYILTADLELGKRNTSTYEKYGAYSPLDVDIAMFDGNGHTIRIYSFAEFADQTIQAGLFKEIKNNMIVMNLNVEYISQNDGNGNWSFGNVNRSYISYADICGIGDEYGVDYQSVLFGGIAPVNNGMVTNCKVGGRIALHASTLENSATDSKEIKFDIGGLVGTNSGYITNSISELQVYALANIGGLVHENTSTGKISSSYFNAQDGKGLIYAYSDVNTEAANAIETRVSGFVVENAGQISMCYTDIGFNDMLGNIGAMTVKDSSAGFVYTNSGKIKDCYVTERILGQSNNTFYGFVYKNSGEISTSYTYINDGGWSEKVRLFAPSGTSGLTDCIEFISTNVGYTVKSQGLNSLTILKSGEKQYNKIDTYKKYNFNFGDNQNSIWIIQKDSMPKLVSTLEKATGNRKVEDTTKTEIIDGKEVTVKETIVYNNGYGTKENPYIIYDLITWDEYMKLDAESGYEEIRSYYRFAADVDFSSITKNLPTTELVFSGNIQGNNMSISGYTIYSEQALKSIGLFKEIKHSGAKEISPAVRNLNINAYSVLAVKTEVVGVLAGYIENYHLYNLTVSCDDTVLGGNVVGGLAGVIGGDIDIENISSTVSVNATKLTVGGVYDLYTSKVNGAEKYQNVNKLNFAGSVAGIVDAFDFSIFSLTTRDIDSTAYKTVKNVFVEGSINVIGENVGGIFGFVGERTKLVNAKIAINGGKITARRNAGMAVAENRGVILNVVCITEDENLFKDSNYVVGGAIGINFGGYLDNANVNVDIIKMTADNTVGGVVGRNVGGNITNSTYTGKLFANIMGGVIGVDNTIEILKTSGTVTSDSSALVFKAYEDVNGIVNTNSITYKKSSVDIDIYKNCSISIETFSYWLDNMNKIYRYSIDTEGKLQTRAIRCLGLFIGRGKENRSDDIYYDADFITFNNGSSLKMLTLGTIYNVEDEKYYLTTLTNVNLNTITYTFNTGYENYINIAGYGNNVFLLLISGSNVDSYDAWESSFDSSRRIMFFDESIIKVEEVENGTPIARPVEPEPPVDPDDPESPADPDDPDDPAGPPATPPVVTPVGPTELFESKFYDINTNGLAATDVISSELDLIKWIDFVAYYRITSDIWLDYTGFTLNSYEDIDQYIDQKAHSSFCWYNRGVRSDTDGDGCKELMFKLLHPYITKNGCNHNNQAANFAISVKSRTFPVDSYTNSIADVQYPDQLVYIFEQNANRIDKFKPLCESGSVAEQVYTKAKNILSTIIKEGDSDLDKARKIHDWMVINVIYDDACLGIKGNYDGKETWETNAAQYAEGALLYGAAVCDGISKAYTILCGIEGIPCIQVTGDRPAGRSGHAWNEIKIDGKWYCVDVGPNNGYDEKFLFGGNDSIYTSTSVTDYNKNTLSNSAYNFFESYRVGGVDLVISSGNEENQIKELAQAAISTSNGLDYVYIQFKDESTRISSVTSAETVVDSALSGLSFELSRITKTRGNGSQEVYILELKKVA